MTIPATMSGVQLTAHGGPETLVWSDTIPVPKPGPGEVLVKIHAAGVNNTDINTRIGWYAKEVTGATDNVTEDVEAGGFAGALNFPVIQGGDLCGTVVSLGAGVTTLGEGTRVTTPLNQPEGPGLGVRVVAPNVQEEGTVDNPVALRVIGSDYDGAFAQFCVVPAKHLYDVTASPHSDVEIAAMPCAYGTAEGLVDRAGVTATDHVLVTGASGGVGMAAVQLAKVRGARVTAVASAAKQDAVLKAGADAVLGRGEIPQTDSATVVIDLVGGPDWPHLLDALRPGGRYAVAGAIAGPMVEMDLRTLYLKDLSLFGCTYQSRAVFQRLVDLINQGAVRPLVSQTYPLAEIHRAQEDFMAKTYPGKLVLIPPQVTP